MEAGMIAPRQVTVDMTLTPEGERWVREVPLERLVRITLARGATFPPDVRRGQAVRLTFNTGGAVVIISGRVKFRRLSVAVIEGRVDGLT